MQVCQHLTHTWLFLFVLLLTLNPKDSTYAAIWSPGCAPADCGFLRDQNYYVDSPVQPLTSCQQNPVTGPAWLPGQAPHLQLNICNPPGETETFVFSAGMYSSWSTCLSSGSTEWCRVTSHGTNVVNVTSTGSPYTPRANTFLCHQPSSDTIMCQRRQPTSSGCNIAVFGNAYPPLPCVCLVWNESQTAVSAWCPADSGLCLGYNTSARSCSPAAAKAGPAADPSRLPRDTVIGIAVACVLLVALLVALITVYVIRRRRHHQPTSSQSSVQSTHSPKTNTGIRPQLRAHSSRTQSMAGRANSHRTKEGHGQDRNGNAYTSHGQVSGSHDQVSGSHDQVSGRHDQVSGSHDQVSGSHDQVSGRHDQVTGRHSQVSGRHDQVSGRHDQVSGRHDQVSGRHDQVSGRHSQVSGRHDQASPADDHIYASIDVSLAVSGEYMGLDESTNYSHAYKTVVTTDPNLRPPMPLPLHVTGQPVPYYSAAEAQGAMSAYRDGETASGQYVDLLEDNTYPDLAVSGGYLVPVSPSSYLQETGQQPRPAVSLVSSYRTPQPAYDRQRPVY